jgi:serine/threonine protein phosphatase 1
MRLLAIGDMHGHLEQLEALLGQVAPTSDDQMVFLGDYIDRGSDSKKVVDGLLRIKEAFALLPDPVSGLARG